MRVLVADDHAVVRRGVRQILEDHWPDVVVGEATTGQEVLDHVRADEWDLLVLDLGMPGRGGMEILKELKHERPKLPILVLSMYAEEQFAVRLLKGGVAGYIAKEGAPSDLVSAINKVMSGGKYVSPSLAEKLAFSLDSWADKRLHETLSDREFEVMRLLASGKEVGEIASALSLSVKTIGTYRRHILEKLNLRNNEELIYYAVHHKLVDLPNTA